MKQADSPEVPAVVAAIAKYQIVVVGHREAAERRGGRINRIPKHHDHPRLAQDRFAQDLICVGGTYAQVRVFLLGQGFVGRGNPIDDELVAAQFHRVPRHADDALDELAAVNRIEEGDDVSALRGRPLRDARQRKRHAQTVGQLVDDDPIPGEDRWLHRTGRHLVPVGDGGAEHQHHRDKQYESAPVEPDRAKFVGRPRRLTGPGL